VVLILLIAWTVRIARTSDSPQERNLLYLVAGVASGVFLLQLFRALQ
jgi:hypothetical protein